MTPRTLESEVERVRRETRRRFAGLVLDGTNPGSYFREHEGHTIGKDVLAQAGDLGLIPFSLPVEVGGAGRDKFSWGVVVEELARLSLDPGFSVLVDTTVSITEVILASGRPELTERYVPDLVAGRSFAALAAYESRDPYDYEATARLDGDTWVLNGTKHFVTGARIADLFVLFLRDEASNDMLAFLVEKDDPGLTLLPLETMGLRTMALAQVVLHEVRVPGRRLMWRADALSRLNAYARGRRTMTACGVVGALEGVIENCLESLATRRRGGRRVLDHPNVERSVGEMRALLQAARAATHLALDSTRSSERDPYFDEPGTVAKHYAAECAVRVGELVMNLQGGEGYVTGFPWERFMRDVLGMIGGQGSQEMLLIQLGQRTVVGLEGRRLRQEAAERHIAKLAESWCALHAAEYGAEGEFAAAARDVVAAAGIEPADPPAPGPPAPGRRDELSALLDRAHALLAAIDSGRPPERMPPGPEGRFEGRLADVADRAWGLLACAVARENGLLTRFLEPCTPKEAAGSLPHGLVQDLLEPLVRASVLREQDGGRYVAEPHLERVLMGGPRASAFAARLRRALAHGARLRGAAPLGRELAAGCGDEAHILAHVLVNSLLRRLEGLPELLAEPEARLGCAAGDGGRSAATLARHLPFVRVLALEPGAVRAPESDAALLSFRTGHLTGFEADDRLALVWLPVAGLSSAQLRSAVGSATEALRPGGWLVLPCPTAPQRALGAAVTRLDAELAGATSAPEAEAEALLRAAGLGHVRVAWKEEVLGVRLVAARRP
ncbi:acyl-CoA dehydrogenase family protein [Streptomyces sp. NPDC048172]|uniref:acyl-CoA dehydrogenase family protein n=1 Tax=Streptomyces sp. NPDC048172 TaxID=3365505 RepID=UPI0037223321